MAKAKRGITLARIPGRGFFRQENTIGNRQDVLVKGRKERLSVDRIERIAPILLCAVEHRRIGRPQLLPGVHSSLAYKAYNVLVRSLVPCRERRPVLRQSR